MPEIIPFQPHALAPGGASVHSSPELHEFGRFWSALLRHHRIFLGIVLGFVALVGFVTLLTPKEYTTTARLIPGTGQNGQSGAPGTDFPILNALVLQTGDQSAETFAALAQQESIADTVAASQNLPIDGHALLSHVSVKPLVNTQILSLSVRWRTPEGSAQIANAFANAFIDSERDFVRSQATAALGFLSSEMPQAQQNMRSSAADLAAFQASNGFVDASTHTQDVVSHATSIEGEIDTLQVDSREATALLRNIRGQMGSMASTVVNAHQISVNPVLTDLRTKLADVELQLASARQQYTDQHPTVIALTKQRDDLQAQIAGQPATVNNGDTYAPNPVYESLAQQAAQYESRIEGDAAKVSELQRERASLTPILRKLPSQEMQLAALQQRAKLTADVYNALQQKYNDATIAKTTAISDLTLVSPASAASAIKSPSLTINLAVALGIGLLLASIIVFVMDYLQRTVRDASDVQMLMGLPVIASIPQFTSSNSRALPWLKSMTVESFLHLCISLRLSKKRALRTLAITSPSKGDGKSTVAFNLAKSMASIHPRILLVDADLRNPTLHQYAGCGNDAGLLQVLRGESTLHDVVQEVVPQLDLLSTGGREINPLAILQSTAFDDIVRDAQGRYTMIIVDTPALSCVPDGFAICAKTDGTAIVIAANTTNERLAQQVVQEMRSLSIENVVGVILNKDRQKLRDYSDYFATSFGSTALPGAK